jgi:hypothetical protein
MLLTRNLFQRGINVMAEKFSYKKKNRYESFSAHQTMKKTAEMTDGLIISILALLVFIIEVILITFLIIRTIKEVKPGADRNVRLILIVLLPEFYGLAYFFGGTKKTNIGY